MIMKVSIFGSGRVGQILGSKVAVLTHEVMPGILQTTKLKQWLSRMHGRIQLDILGTQLFNIKINQ